MTVQLAWVLFTVGLLFGIPAGLLIAVLLHDAYRLRYPDKFRRKKT